MNKELHKKIPKATDKMLAQQLRELEKDGLIKRTVYPVVPPKTEYNLTEFGESLSPILNAMCNWGESYLNIPRQCVEESRGGKEYCVLVQSEEQSTMRD